MKICCRCREKKELEEFHKDKNSSDGRVRVCKTCASTYNKIRRPKQETPYKRPIFPRSSTRRTAEDGMKFCTTCRQNKPVNRFSKMTNNPDGLQDHCKDCHRNYMRGYQRRAHKKAFGKLIEKEYGIPFELYQEAFEKQNGVCAICGIRAYTSRRLKVDFNGSGAIKGLLCANCLKIVNDKKVIDYIQSRGEDES